MIRRYLISIFCLFNYIVYSQDLILNFDGDYCYEMSAESVLLDDMIYRKRVVYLYKNFRPQLRNKVFVFEPIPGNIKIDTSKFEKTVSKKIIEALDWTNDSNHKILKNYDSKIIEYRNLKYKIFKLKFKALYIGQRKHNIRNGNKFKTIKSATYLIFDFIEIKIVPSPDRSDM